MLKRILFSLGLILALATSAHAADQKIVVVDIQRIMRDSLAAKDLKTQLDAQKQQYQGEVDAKQDKLKKERDDLEKQKAILAKDALAQKEKSFLDEYKADQKDVQEKQVAYDNAYKSAVEVIQKNVQDIINGMATEQSFTLALPTSTLIYADKTLDITEEVLKRLDKKLPKVQLKTTTQK